MIEIPEDVFNDVIELLSELRHVPLGRDYKDMADTAMVLLSCPSKEFWTGHNAENRRQSLEYARNRKKMRDAPKESTSLPSET